MSMEADLYPRHHAEMAILVDGAIGEGSLSHELFVYYAQGVGPGTAIWPFPNMSPGGPRIWSLSGNSPDMDSRYLRPSGNA